MEQGATSMPIVWKEPLAMEAPMFELGWTTLANASTSLAFQSVSCVIVARAAGVRMRCVSTEESRAEGLQGANPVDDARGAGDGDNHALRSTALLHCLLGLHVLFTMLQSRGANLITTVFEKPLVAPLCHCPANTYNECFKWVRGIWPIRNRFDY